MITEEGKKEVRYHDNIDYCDSPLTEAEVAELLDMFESKGWKIFRRMCVDSAIEACEDALNIESPENMRLVSTALYHAGMQPTRFELSVNEAVHMETVGYEDVKEALEEIENRRKRNIALL